MALQARKNPSRWPWELGRRGVLVRILVLAPLSLPLMPDSQGAQEAGRGSGTEGEAPFFHTHPPALSYWKEQMQMDLVYSTQNTLPCFLGAHCKLKQAPPGG